jgi:hypothetical protein
MTYSAKYMRSAGVAKSADRWVKRYHLSATADEISREIQDAAYDFLPRLLPRPDSQTPPAGWVILHKGNGVPAYLIAYSWTWDNVVECRAAVAGLPDLGSADENPANFSLLDRKWAGCVWELAPLDHERSAWIRHVLTPQTPDLQMYLADTLPDGWH